MMDPAHPIVSREDKPHIFEDEDVEKPVPKVDKIDYSGAHAKTDPKEIALVKKLDRWIMVSNFHRNPKDLEKSYSPD